MAFTLADAVVYFRGDDSQLEKSMSGAQGKVGNFVGGATKLLGGALLGGAAAAAGAIVGIGAAAFDVSVQTEKATAGIAASLGLTTEEAERFGEVARSVYGNNFADSVTDAGDAVAEVAKRFQLAADDPSLQRITENAFRLRDAFGVDVTEGLDAAQTLMQNFGLTSDEAFNMIAAGYQKGLDRSGDFLDTIGEYSTQFSSGGASAQEFFGLLESGLQGGVLGTDKAADAFKEFQVRILDGSTLTADSLAALGINADEFTEKLASGQMTTTEAFNEVLGKLGEVDDQALLMQTGVGLLGTQFEDLGKEAALQLSAVGDGFTDTQGRIDSLDAKYATFGDAVSGIWRRLTTSISPFTDKLLELVNSAMPAVMGAFDTFDENVGPIIETAGGIIQRVVDLVSGLFNNQWAPAVGTGTGAFQILKNWIDENMPLIQQTVETVTNAIKAAWEVIGPPLQTIVETMFGNLKIVIETTLNVVLGIVKTVLQLINGDFEGAGASLQSIVQTLWDGISGIFRNNLDGIGRLVGNFDLAGAGRAIVDGLRRGISDKWDDLTSWFRRKLESLRNMLPFSEPRDPQSPLRNLSKAGEGIIEQIQKGLDQPLSGAFLNPVATAAGGGGGGPVTISLIQNFYGPADGQTVERGSRRGLTDALRQLGVR